MIFLERKPKEILKGMNLLRYKKIAIVTSTRAEYGLLSPVIKEIRKHETEKLKVDLIVTGMHLDEKYGMTVNEIEERIDYIIPISMKSDSDIDISSNQSETLMRFSSLFHKEKYIGVILLGDRYEIFAVAIAAGNTRTPIFHLCGGDTTEGAMDEWMRHSITKISYLHFVTNEKSRQRVIQLGEAPDRVFNYGSTSIDNIASLPDTTKEVVLKSIGLPSCRYALFTYHPVTMEDGDISKQMNVFFEIFKGYPEILFIATKSNADQGGAMINTLLDQAECEIPNLRVYASLGTRRYLMLMRHAEFVIGNSSSGIIETPVFHVPTINVGDRQKGRMQSESVVNCDIKKEKIDEAIHRIYSAEHREICKSVISPYGSGGAGKRIADKILEVVEEGRIDLKKSFFDMR